MKLTRNKFPIRPEEFEYNTEPTPEDLEHVSSLVKQDKIKEFEDFVNKKMIAAELDPNRYPGLPTRDYLASALHRSILDRYPHLKDMSQENQIRFLKNKTYPGLSLLKNIFQLSNKISTDPMEGSKLQTITRDGKQAGEINVDPHAQSFIDDALHELSHSVDQPIKLLKRHRRLYGDKSNLENEEAAMKAFIERNPKLKKLMDSETDWTTASENRGRYQKIGRSPNFEDYDWKAGEFGSDIIQNPIDKYKEVGREHHIDRPFSYDNFINFTKGDLRDIVKSQDRFNALRKRLS